MSTASVKTPLPEPSHSRLVQRTVEACELAREAAAIAAEGIATGSMSHLNAIQRCEKELDAIDLEVDSGVTSTITRVPEAETGQLLACMKVMIGLERIGDLLLSFATSAQAAGTSWRIGVAGPPGGSPAVCRKFSSMVSCPVLLPLCAMLTCGHAGRRPVSGPVAG